MAATAPKLKATTDAAALVLHQASNLVRMYVSADPNSPIIAMQRSLPQRVDDAVARFGIKVYDDMRKDAVVAGILDLLRMRGLENGASFLPAIRAPAFTGKGRKDDPDYRLAVQLADEQRAAHDDFDVPIEDVFFEMYDAVLYGHRLAEKGSATVDLGNGLRVIPTEILTKPIKNYAFVVDPSNRPQGVIAAIPGVAVSIPISYLEDFRVLPNFLAYGKFFHVKFGGASGTPLGDSMFRPAYEPWWLKMQTWPQLLKYIIQFAGPSLIAYTPPGTGNPGTASETVALASGEVVPATPENVMLSLLEHFQAGTIVALQGGSKVDLIQSDGEGKAHVETINLCNREITLATLKQTRSTLEAEHGSRADSKTGQDLQDVVIKYLQSLFERTYRRQVLRPYVAVNHGDDVARRLTPRLVLQSTATQDMAAARTGVAALMTAGYIHWTQQPGLDEELDLPPRDMDVVMQEMAEQRDQQHMQAADSARMISNSEKADNASS